MAFSQKRQIGLIAQEVEEVFPELVHTDESGYKSVEYSKITAILIEAVKEQQAQIESLRKENNEVLNQHSRIESRLAKMESFLFSEFESPEMTDSNK